MATLRELALAAGFDIDIALVPASDPAAAVAARVIADPATPSLDELLEGKMADEGDAEAIADWVARLERLADGDHQRLLQLAGRYSTPQHRKGARFFAPKPGMTQDRMVEMVNSALGRRLGAMSGVAAARAYAGHAPDPGPVVAWTTDTDTDCVAERLSVTLREHGEYQPAGVLLAPTMRGYFADLMKPPVWEHRIVSPIQAAIDLYGLGYDELADEITDGW